MILSESDVRVLRALAVRYAEIASLPEQKARKERWIRHNALAAERPLVLLDQLPWNELNVDGSLNRRVENSIFASVESWLLQEIYKWTHCPGDMVIDPYVKIPYPHHNSGWGLNPKITTLRVEGNTDVESQRMENLIREPEDIDQIHTPLLTVDETEVREISEAASYVFDGILPWRFSGICMHLGAWDTIAYWMGVENCYIELMDRPEMMHALMEKMTTGYLSMIDQLNRLKIFDVSSHYCHCSHTYRADDAENAEPVSENSWAFGLAQLFTSVSPRITEEFECAYMKRVFPRFKHIYYGCCDRLDDRMEIVASLPNVRKISCSPWSHRETFAEKLPKSIIMSNKPSPALLATDTMDEDAVRADLRRTIDAARKNGATLEMILKDVSTVRHDPSRLTRFSEIALEEAER